MVLELATNNITFKWISDSYIKAADCLSHPVELPQAKPVSINVLSVTDKHGPALNTRSQTHECLSADTSTPQPGVTPDVSEAKDPMPKSLTADRLQALLQMQKTDPFCKRKSKQLSKGQALKGETDLFTHIRGLLFKHNRFWSEILSSGYTQVMEAYCIG